MSDLDKKSRFSDLINFLKEDNELFPYVKSSSDKDNIVGEPVVATNEQYEFIKNSNKGTKK